MYIVESTTYAQQIQFTISINNIMKKLNQQADIKANKLARQ